MDDEIKKLVAEEVEKEAEEHFGERGKGIAEKALSGFGLKAQAETPPRGATNPASEEQEDEGQEIKDTPEEISNSDAEDEDSAKEARMLEGLSHTLTCLGRPLDTTESAFGWLRDSTDIVHDPKTLRQRMAEEGYLYLPAYLDREQVLQARRELTRRLAEKGLLQPGTDPMEAIAREGVNVGFMPELALNNPALHRVLYEGRMMELYERLLGGEVRYYDYTWVRAVSPGNSTPPHCDVVYMGRGTHNLFTSWTPMDDIDLMEGGLMVLENSHKHARLREVYCKKDVDSWCENRTDRRPGIGAFGMLTNDPARLRQRLGGRWLTSPLFRMGDLLLFCVYLVHASLDNRSKRIRLSTDSRYQLASEPVDERWVGEHPIGHGAAAMRPTIC